jgi:hypothetical protein
MGTLPMSVYTKGKEEAENAVVMLPFFVLAIQQMRWGDQCKQGREVHYIRFDEPFLGMGTTTHPNPLLSLCMLLVVFFCVLVAIVLGHGDGGYRWWWGIIVRQDQIYSCQQSHVKHSF